MIGTILNFLFVTFFMIKCILSPVNTNRNPMTIKSNKDQLTWLEKRFPKRGINNSNRGYNALLITFKFMVKYFFKKINKKLHFKKYNRFIVLVDNSFEISNISLTLRDLIDTHHIILLL